MNIKLLIFSDCPHGPAAADLIRTAVAHTRVKATVSQTVITTEDEARARGFTGSPTILLNRSDPFAQSGAPVALSCRLYATRCGLQGMPDLRDLRHALKRVAVK
jgi:hypothetical protein